MSREHGYSLELVLFDGVLPYVHALPILFPLLAPVLAMALSLSVAPASASACVIEAQTASIDALEVAPIAEQPFELSVHQLPVQITPGPGGQSEVAVLAPLAFRSKHATDKIDIRFARRSSLASGRVIVATGGAPTILPADETAGSDAVSARLTMREFVPEAPIAVPCSALTVSAENEIVNAQSLVLPQGKISYLHTDARLPLYAEAEAHDPLWMRFKGVLQVVGRKPGWLHVKASWEDGSRLEGWIPAALARVQSGRPLQEGTGQLGTIGIGTCGRSHPPRLAAFTVRAGAPIHSQAKGAIWAHSASVIKVEAFPLARSDGWLQIAAIDGLPGKPCSEHSNIWVHASDLVWTAKPL